MPGAKTVPGIIFLPFFNGACADSSYHDEPLAENAAKYLYIRPCLSSLKISASAAGTFRRWRSNDARECARR